MTVKIDHRDSLAYEARLFGEAARDMYVANAEAGRDLLALSLAVRDLLVEAVVRPDASALLGGLRWMYQGGVLCTKIVGAGAARASRVLQIATAQLRAENDTDGRPTGSEVRQAMSAAVATAVDGGPQRQKDGAP